jgi:hypothetical protein
MSTPCVILASTPFDDAADNDVALIEGAYKNFSSGNLQNDLGLYMEVKNTNDNEGGNGGGGEAAGDPVRPALSGMRTSLWDFQAFDTTENDRSIRYPEVLRFDLCIDYTDMSRAVDFLHKDPLGQAIGRVFAFVVIIANSQRK